MQGLLLSNNARNSVGDEQLSAARRQLTAAEQCNKDLQDELSKQQMQLSKQLHQLQEQLRDKDKQLKVGCCAVNRLRCYNALVHVFYGNAAGFYGCM